MKDIAVVILNHIQYVNIFAGLKELKRCGYSIDVYCSDWVGDPTGMNNMFDDIADYCKKNGFDVLRKTDPNMEYKVLLEPYPYHDITAKYKIKYRYSNISAKPNIVYKPENYIMYDAILCSGDYDSNYLSVFSKTYKTAAFKYQNFKKSELRKSNKKQLLYLPTYGKESSIEQIVDVLDEIRERYYIVAKIHHGTNFLVNEHNRIDILKEKVDEFYDSHMPLMTLLETTDIILTDNSGSIFEGIFTQIPVAVFCDDINKNKIGEFNTTQYELFKEGVLPFTSDPNEIINILEKAQSKDIIEKQRAWDQANFYHPENLTIDFVNVVKSFLDDNIDKRYYQMHNVFKESYYANHKSALKNKELQNQNAELKNYIDVLENTNKDLQSSVADLSLQRDNLISRVDSLSNSVDELSRQLNYYNSGILYKLAKKIYKLKNGG